MKHARNHEANRKRRPKRVIDTNTQAHTHRYSDTHAHTRIGIEKKQKQNMQIFM